MPKILTLADRQQKRQAILDAAAKEIAHYGYDRANINTIAERARIGRGTIYLYFASKEDVLEALLDAIGKMIDSTVQECLELDAPWQDKIHALASAFAYLAREHQDFFRVHVSALHGVNRDIGQPVAHWLRHSVDLLAEALDNAAAVGSIQRYDAHTLAIMLLGMLESLALLPYVLNHEDDRDEQRADTLAHFIWQGIAPLALKK
jgi:AcrR family transcriptional regulator